MNASLVGCCWMNLSYFYLDIELDQHTEKCDYRECFIKDIFIRVLVDWRLQVLNLLSETRRWIVEIIIKCSWRHQFNISFFFFRLLPWWSLLCFPPTKRFSRNIRNKRRGEQCWRSTYMNLWGNRRTLLGP